VYVDPVQKRARWKLVAVGARKKLNNGWRAAKLTRRRSAKTAKKHKNRQKSNTTKYQTKTRIEEAGDEKKGRGHRV
jgi:hypothetical protein